MPLLRTLIRSRMPDPLPHHRLAKTQISGAILPRPAARVSESRPKNGCFAPRPRNGCYAPPAEDCRLKTSYRTDGTFGTSGTCGTRMRRDRKDFFHPLNRGAGAAPQKISRKRVCHSVNLCPISPISPISPRNAPAAPLERSSRRGGVGGKQASAQLSRPREVRFAHPPEKRVLCTPFFSAEAIFFAKKVKKRRSDGSCALARAEKRVYITGSII